MNLFVEYHHGGLYESLRLLFEKRLGWNLFRPIGTEWQSGGYWRIAEVYGNHPSTIRQYLGIDAHSWESAPHPCKDYTLGDGIYYIYDEISKSHHKAITLDKFKEMQFDIIISTYQPHDVPYDRLRDLFQPKAKRIAQMGNIYQTTHVPNVMCSTMPYLVEPGKNVVFYHQEFSLDTFKYVPPVCHHAITGFVNLFPVQELYLEYKYSMPEYIFKHYGIGGPDGVVTGYDRISSLMAGSGFGWHIKPGGDGFGHVIHNWYACGRPVITRYSEYVGKLASQLMTDNVTAIFIDNGTVQENCTRIRRLSEPENHLRMCEAAHRRFTELVSFDNEAGRISEFLGRLI
ncbi:MAG: hypothetical protein WC822_04500 [Candidatus Paceibacterota bacterium]